MNFDNQEFFNSNGESILISHLNKNPLGVFNPPIYLTACYRGKYEKY